MFEVIKRFKWVIIGVSALMVGLLIFIFAHNAVEEARLNEGPETTDVYADYETLNDHLSALLESAEFKYYESDSFSTRYNFTSTDYLYDTTKPWWTIKETSAKNGASITAFATALSILSGKKITPAAVGYITKKNNFWDLSGYPPENLYENLASFYGIFYRSVPVMNHNILDYYLDKGAVIIIRGRGEEPYGEGGNFLVVYVGSPADGLYTVSSPISEDFRGIPLSRDAVLGSLKSSEAFYVLSGATSKYDFSSYSEEFNPSAGNENSLTITPGPISEN